MNTLKMHRYIIGWVGLFIAFAVTLPFAMMRVSKTEKFAEQPFNSLTCEGQVPGSRAVTKFPACAQMQVELITQKSGPSPSVSAGQSTTTPLIDPFVEAFRIAEQAVTLGRTAQSAADWHNLAPQWQQAAELMSRVVPEDPRYAIAQHRVSLYDQNRQAVLERARSAFP